MKVTASFHGILTDWVGVERADFELPEEALFSDLLREIARKFRNNMPEQLWDDQQYSFKRQVVATSGERLLESKDVPLREGQEITFLLMLAGG